MQSKLTTTDVMVAPAAVRYLRRMPIAPSASFNFTLQVRAPSLLADSTVLQVAHLLRQTYY